MKSPDGYAHPEAFCFMTYATRDRSVVEVLWNSRDGVTPFLIRTRDRAHEMQHVDWKHDVRAPHHVPKIGDRVFVDLTMERALAYRTPYVEREWERIQVHPYFEGMTKEQAIRDLAHSDMTRGLEGLSAEQIAAQGSGPPDLIVVDQAFIDTLLATRRAAS